MTPHATAVRSTPWAAHRAAAPPPPGEVHVWRIDLRRAPGALAADRALLSDDERRRAARHRFPLHAERWIAARAALRRILAAYAGADPADLAFDAGAGKPRLAGPGSELSFNLAHSAELALCAVARGREVGVDVERTRPDVAALALAARWFARSEQDAIRALPAAHRPAAFFACWTRKEAWVKARGGRVPTALRTFAVSVEPRADGEVAVTVAGEPDEGARWSVVALDPGPGFAGAVAVEGRARFALYQWDG